MDCHFIGGPKLLVSSIRDGKLIFKQNVFHVKFVKCKFVKFMSMTMNNSVVCMEVEEWYFENDLNFNIEHI